MENTQRYLQRSDLFLCPGGKGFLNKSGLPALLRRGRSAMSMMSGKENKLFKSKKRPSELKKKHIQMHNLLFFPSLLSKINVSP